MNRIFGKKKEQAPAKAAPTLDQANEKMDSRAKAYEQKIADCDKQLRALKEKIKTTRGSAKKNYERRAMEVLKRKRLYEQQLDQLMAQQFNIEQTAFGVESAAMTVATLGAMKGANAQLKAQMQELNIDDVDDVQDDLAELMEEMNDVNESLARSYAMPEDIDEADLEAELDLLEDEFEEVDAVPSYLQETDSLPAQPTSTPGEKVDASPAAAVSS
eukprot:CAMPEP_0116015204 /NCGR_PEP_ID=MMETSP0321-20121206/6703_1 /TAXON_ID=163516 /ORGANISM="Leptocylindrus danicus var. danicus, Strain B650" /LENGTH=215 /DNA_ID=CAMNT_0003484941 /DNA_START=81 /DNA_END=728 /DNA_ORIENTATION=+